MEHQPTPIQTPRPEWAQKLDERRDGSIQFWVVRICLGWFLAGVNLFGRCGRLADAFGASWSSMLRTVDHAERF